VPIEASDAMRRLVWRSIDQLVRTRLKQTQALHRCLGDYEATYDEQNRRTGLLGFSDYVTLLTNAEPFDKDEMAYRLDCTIKHWLLDEFQDTSTQQFAVLERNISEIVEQPQEDRSVFVVGDLKQSLYEWRAGNRKLLGNLHQAIARNGVNLSLDETRRCAPAVLEMVNAVLGGHAEQGLGRLYSETAAADWSETFHEQKAVSEAGKPAKPGEAAWVRITKPKESEETEDQLQARWIGEHLKATPGILMPDGRLRPGLTCAILVSKNKQAAEITQILRMLGVEATDEAKTSVIEDNPVTAGLLALIQTTVHPDNGLAKGMAEISPAAAAFLKAHGGWDGAAESIANRFAEAAAEGLADLLAKDVDLTGDTGFIRKRLGQLRSVA
ncbi:MAG: UvrD-helicase domain-containing protein, partial [Opitutales bacterium]|nr:UvrD-helicase domain-containing protein [Opitutales bacterium]